MKKQASATPKSNNSSVITFTTFWHFLSLRPGRLERQNCTRKREQEIVLLPDCTCTSLCPHITCVPRALRSQWTQVRLVKQIGDYSESNATLYCSFVRAIFIRPGSDHLLPLSVTDSLTNWLSFRTHDGCEWCQLPPGLVKILKLKFRQDLKLEFAQHIAADVL